MFHLQMLNSCALAFWSWFHFHLMVYDYNDHSNSQPKRAEDLLKLGRHQLKMATAIYTGHAPVRVHLYTMGLFDGNPICKFCGMETETVQHIIFCCEAMARQRYNVFGRLTVEPKDISTASIRDLCLFI